MSSIAQQTTDINDTIPLAVPVRILPSQQKVLEQLHYLTTFRNQMVILAGPTGAGKSTLLESFLEQASDYANLAYLIANPRLTIAQVRQRLLQQISHVQQAPAEASLSKTIRRTLPTLSGTEGQHLMLVIDDAHTLDPVIIDELQELVLHSRFTGGRHRISVVLSGAAEWAARQRKSLPSNTSDAPEVLLVPELSDEEALHFAKALLNSHERGKGLAMNINRVQAALGTCLNYPGIIQDQLSSLLLPAPKARYHIDDQESHIKLTSSQKKAATKAKAKPTTSSSRVQSGSRRIAIAFSGALLLALAAMGFLYQEPIKEYVIAHAPDAVLERLGLLAGDEPETTAIASAEAVHTPSAEGVEIETAELVVPQRAGTSQLTMNFDEALGRLTQAAREYQPERDLQVGLMRVNHVSAQETPPAQTSAANEETALSQATAAREETTPLPTETVTETEASIAVAETSSNPWMNAHDNAYFWQQDGDRVTLQLAAVRTQAGLDRFYASMAENGTPTDNLMVYHTLRDERSWYVITTGNYGSIEQARTAISQLPAGLQQLQPWAKPIAWVQNELQVVLGAP